MTPPSRTNRRGELPFWVLSVVLHAVVLTLVLVFSPVREIVFRRKQVEQTKVITRGDELEAVIEQIRDRTVEKLEARVALVREGQDRMARNFTILNEHFQPFEVEQRATARARMSHYIDVVTKGQDELLLALRRQRPEELRSVPDTAVKTVARVLTSQEEIRRGIRLLNIGDAAFLKRQEGAEDAQYSTGQFLRFLEEDVANLEREEARLTPLGEELTERNRLLVEADRALEEATPETAAAAERRAAAEAVWRDLPRTVQGADRDRVREVLDAAKREDADAKRRLNEAESAARKARENVARTEAEIEKVRTRLAELAAARDRHLSEAYSAQQRAGVLQREIVAVIADARGEDAP